MNTSKYEYMTDLRRIINFKENAKPVELDSIPEVFRKDLNRFIMGETLQAINGKIVVGEKRYKEWIYKIMNTGLDYEIILKNS